VKVRLGWVLSSNRSGAMPLEREGLMYLNLRRYPRIGVSKDIIERSVETELLPELQKQSGFKGYCAFWDQDGAGVSMSLFEDAEAAHHSTDSARRWVMRHQDFFPKPNFRGKFGKIAVGVEKERKLCCNCRHVNE
jgi:hypothetical protein